LKSKEGRGKRRKLVYKTGTKKKKATEVRRAISKKIG